MKPIGEKIAEIKADAVEAREKGKPKVAEMLNELADIGTEIANVVQKGKPK